MLNKRKATREQEFDRLCAELGIEYWQAKLRTPKTHCTVERFNGRIGHALKTHRFDSCEGEAQTLLRHIALYNHQFPQATLKSKTPMQTIKNSYASHPHLFRKRFCDRREFDSHASAYKAGKASKFYTENPRCAIFEIFSTVKDAPRKNSSPLEQTSEPAGRLI